MAVEQAQEFFHRPLIRSPADQMLAQVRELQDKADTLRLNVENVHSRIDRLSGLVDSLLESVSALQCKVDGRA